MNKIRMEIIKLLHLNPDSFVSGQELSDKLEVSRTTISNYIKDLREKGYKIKSKTNKGYKLIDSPDRIIPEEIIWKLNTEKIGKKIIFFNEVESTNEKAKTMAGEVPEGTVIITEKQKKGKGRRGREWYSPPGSGLWFSIILYPDFQPDKAPMLTVLAALAVEASLEKMNIEADIKWPNDVLLNNMKIAGILSELNAEIDQINYAVVGIGINVNQDSFPQKLKNTATSLKIELGKNIDRIDLLNYIFYSFEKYYQMLLSDEEEKLLKIWKNKLNCLNKSVVIDNNGRIYRGKAVDISLRGELIIKDKKGEKHSFWTGDTSLKGLEEGEKNDINY